MRAREKEIEKEERKSEKAQGKVIKRERMKGCQT